MLKSFINYLKYEKRYSPHTVISYQNDITSFYNYILDTYSVEDVKKVTHFMIRSWLVKMMQDGMSSKTVNRKFSALRSYFIFLKRNGIINGNPAKKVIPPKISKRLPVTVQKNDMDKLLDEIVFEENFQGYRNKIIISLLYNTGMRRAELINLKDGSFDFINNSVKVLGKGNKERIIPLTNDVIKLLKEYLEMRDKHFECTQFDYTIVTDKGKKLYPRFVYDVVKSNLSKVSPVQRRSPHILRHSIATHLADEEVDLNAIKAMLGHASLSATQIYTHNSVEKLRKAYIKAHPKAK